MRLFKLFIPMSLKTLILRIKQLKQKMGMVFQSEFIPVFLNERMRQFYTLFMVEDSWLDHQM